MGRVLSLLLLLTLAGCKGCGEDPPPPPPLEPETTLLMHAHFGRPGATAGLFMSMVRSSESATELLRSGLGIPESVYAQVDLSRPLDVVALRAGGSTHQLALFGATPGAEEQLGEQLEPITARFKRIRSPDGESRCALLAQRVVCADTPKGIGGVTLVAERRANKWEQDRTDAVIELDGEHLRQRWLPRLSSVVGTVVGQILERIHLGGKGPVPPPLKQWDVTAPLDLPTIFAGVQKTTLRLRINSKGVLVDARIDSPQKGAGAFAALTRAVERARPMPQLVARLPSDITMVLAFGGATPAGHRQLLRRTITAELDDQASVKGLQAQLASLWSTTSGGYALAHRWNHDQRELYELHGINDRAKARAALDAIADGELDLVDEAGDPLPAAVRVTDAGRILRIGDHRFGMAVVGDALAVIAGGDGVDEALADLVARDGLPTSESIAHASRHPLTAMIDLQALLKRKQERSVIDFAFHRGTPDANELRGAAVLRASPHAVRMLYTLVMRGQTHLEKQNPGAQ